MVSENNPIMDEDDNMESNLTLSDVSWDKWSEQGNKEFLLVFSSLVKNKNEENLEDSLQGCTKAMHLLISKCLKGSVTAEQVVTVINKVMFWHFEVPSIIVDVLSVFDLDSNSFEGDTKKKFIILSKALSKMIPVKLFKERYEMESLNDLDILPNKNFPSKFIKIKTRLYYKQNKFNLLREETEGFSKLVICLFNRRISKEGGVSLEESKNLVLSLCGWFSLDPGRVLDIILDIFESNLLYHHVFIPLIKEFVRDSEMLLEVIIFRYSLYFKDPDGTPFQMHSVVTHLINNNMLNFHSLYNEIEPSLDEMYNEIKTKFSQPVPKAISLNKSNEQQNTEQDFEMNQKLGLIESLLISGRWDLFNDVLNDVNKEYLVEQELIAGAICRLIHYLIEPVYNKLSTLGPKSNVVDNFKDCTLKPVENIKGFVSVILPMLELLGPCIKHDPSLIFKICRLLISLKTNGIKEEGMEEDFDIVILKIIEQSFLPALSHLESNCCVTEILWDLIKLYPIAVRYCAYSNWKEYSSTCPTVLKRKAQTSYIIRNCMKKVSKENVKPMGRIMGKISHHAPIELCEHILYQIQMYDSLILPVVESLKYLNTMAYDILSYVILEAFRNDPKKRSKHDGNNPSPWFLNTAVFCASILKKYSLDMTGLLKYILEQLLDKNYVELLVFKEILQKMTGIEITDEMTDDQIDALGGGECLRGEAAYFVPLRSMKRSANRLKDALVHEDLLATASIVIAQLKYNIVYEEEDFHLKFLGKLYDECHDALLQYGTFISGYSSDELNFEFPPLETLVLDFHITHESAFFLCRQFLIHKAKLKAITNTNKDALMNGVNVDSDGVHDENKKPELEENKSPRKSSICHVNNLDNDTLSCISSEDLEEVLEEEPFGPTEDPDQQNVIDDDITHGKKTTTINEIYDMQVCEKAQNNFDWDAEDNETWTKHNNDDTSNNKILEYKDDMEVEEDEDDLNCSDFPDIPKIFNIPPESENCQVESIEILDESNPEHNDEDIIILDEDNEEDKKGSSEKKSQEVKDLVEIVNEQSNDKVDDDNTIKSSNSSKLVNVLLDGVLPSVLKIQDNTALISEEISPYASAVFWTLTLYDIHVPVDLYDKEINKLKQALINQEQSKESSSKIKKEVDKLNVLIERLSHEKRRHVKHVKSVVRKLDETKNEWFAPQTHKNAKNELINVLLHSCILPRVLFSALDAVYCAKFILTLHQLHTENFSTVLCYDRLLCDIKNLVAMCSENEASRFGRFLCAILGDVMRFHSSPDIYNTECANTPGFITKFRSTSDNIDPSDKVHYENYRHLCHKWHFKITKALLCLLDSKEYILIRNTIIVLKKILPHFPVIMKLAQCIEKKIGKIKQEEKDVRQDLHTLATSYWGHLKSKMSSMMDESKFHLVDNQDNNKESETKEKTKKEEKKEEKQQEKEKVKQEKEKAKQEKVKIQEEEEEFPLSKSDTESPKRKKEEDSNTKLRRSVRSDSKAATRANKRSHSQSSNKKIESKSSEEGTKKIRSKKTLESRSKSMESSDEKKSKHVEPEEKKVKKKEKKVTKRKDVDGSPTERKYKSTAKTKRN